MVQLMLPLSRMMPDTCRPSSRSSSARHGTSVKSRARSTSANLLPLTPLLRLTLPPRQLPTPRLPRRPTLQRLLPLLRPTLPALPATPLLPLPTQLPRPSNLAWARP